MFDAVVVYTGAGSGVTLQKGLPSKPALSSVTIELAEGDTFKDLSSLEIYLYSEDTLLGKVVATDKIFSVLENSVEVSTELEDREDTYWIFPDIDYENIDGAKAIFEIDGTMYYMDATVDDTFSN